MRTTKNIYIPLLSFCLLILLVQCTKDNLFEKDEITDTGYLLVSPRIDFSLLKSAQLVSTDSFKIEIYTSADVLVQEIENFIDFSSPLELNVGDYYVVIHSNNLVPAAFNNPYYEGRSADFQITKGTTTDIDVTAELANVKVTVEYGAQAQVDFTGFKTVVSTGTDSLTYLNQDTTAGYFIVTPLSVRAVLTYDAGGSSDSLIIQGEIPNPQAKDHITITVQAALGEGGINAINLTVDESTNPVNVTIQDTGSVNLNAGILTDDRNGKQYETVQIGNQTWMAENLDFLPAGESLSGEFPGSESTAFYYQIDPAKGIIYNWPAAMNGSTVVGTQGVCPSGWHIPSSADWNELESFIQNDGNTPFNAGLVLKATSGWGSPGTDNYNFTALPNGRRSSSSGFVEQFTNGYWWTSNDNGTGSGAASFRNLSDFSINLVSGQLNKSNGMSVRCIKD